VPIIDMQRRITEAGRIRIGQQVATRGGKTRPAKLETFRLTSPSKDLIDAAAQLYGGQIKPWKAPAGNQFEVITESDTLPVIVPPTTMAFTQWYELWSADGCQRRCDGVTEQITDAPCLCDAVNRECSTHTRLSVMLADLPGIGLWRLDTQGIYAAIELGGTVDLIHNAARHGELLPAVLRLTQRETHRPGEQVKRYAVPTLDVTVTPAQLLGGRGLELAPPRQLVTTNGGAPLTPVPATNQPTPSIEEQTRPPEPARRRTQLPVPATGLAPRTREQASAQDVGGGDRPPKPGTPATDPDLIDHIQRAQQTWNDTYDRITRQPDTHRQTMTDNDAFGDAPQLDAPIDTHEPERPATPAQNRKMHALFRALDLLERADRLTITSAILGYHIDTSSSLTIREAGLIIETLETTWLEDADYPIGDRIRDILNTAALKDAENQGDLFGNESVPPGE
jgi:hypothetical protein